MKIKYFSLLGVLLILLTASCQGQRPSNTASARAAYSTPPSYRPSKKGKKTSKRKRERSRPEKSRPNDRDAEKARRESLWF